MRALLTIVVALAWLPTTAAAQTPGYTTVSEAAGVVRVPITLAAAPLTPLDVTWQTGNPTGLADAPYATPGSDYVSASGTVTFAPGETTKEVEITLVDDAMDESGGFFAVRAGSNEELIVILDDDPTPAPSIADARVAEDAGEVTLTVTRPAPTELGPMGYLWTVQPGTSDVRPASGELGLKSTDTTTTFTVPIPDDALKEPDETFTVTLTVAPTPLRWGATPSEPPADGTATVTIVDDDPLVTIRSGSVLVGPGTAPLVDVRQGVAEYAGARLSGAMFRIRSGSLIALAGRCGRTLSVDAPAGLRVRAGRVTSVARVPARWTVSDGCSRTVVRVLSGRVRVGSRVLRAGQRYSARA